MKPTRTQTRNLRGEVFERSGFACECGCHRYLYDEGQLDHFWGRAKAKQSAENCWALSARCHSDKTNNFPSAADWVCRFINHCLRHDFHDEADKALARLRVIRQKAAV